MCATRGVNGLVLAHGISMNHRQTRDPTAGDAPSTTRASSVLELAETREHFAPPEATRQIASWVNEGGAGGEVRR
ncbi:hypothetical protein CCR94_17345 [Rhodoblastus sphagnicola]|uniref:Uncharacterized protein n=1 Tax=Rhodoblastus sphagnicola TaxID=333368 RepID=A0A2S6N1V6_9HYPH|nr:hypothetical protein [Rhodoblastus sphagnicola]PPQ28607.1 hypothetical protein CCR94_17345 [Rhodoblastus sphagnicola]